MKTTLLIGCFSCLTFLGIAQNWNVFNKSYRYNYRHDSSGIISNVLFQDSVKQIGSDTIYYLNRVVTECSSTCPGFSVSFTPTNPAVVTNMPQFMQRSLRKYSNGIVMLLDPGKLVLKPNCTLNQSWLFDSTANYSATCTAVGLQTIFGVSDSVKTIVINNSDTLVLSKTFGVTRFPQLYGLDKSYRLVGIEKSASYDQQALYGQKVPNAWDFYNYQVGDVFCEMRNGYKQDIVLISKCSKSQYGILSKTVTPVGYQYTVNLNYTPGITDCNGPLLFTTTVISFTNLSSPSLVENRMYPGMVVYNQPGFQYPNVVFFANDAQGVFYKVMGLAACGKTNTPSGKYPALFNPNNPGATEPSPYYMMNALGAFQSALVFAEGFGLIYSKATALEISEGFCKSCFMRSNNTVFGDLYLGVENIALNNTGFKMYPNPATNTCLIKIESSGSYTLEVNSVLGVTIYRQTMHSEKDLVLDTKPYEPGIYFVSIYKGSTKLAEKKLLVNH